MGISSGQRDTALIAAAIGLVAGGVCISSDLFRECS